MQGLVRTIPANEIVEQMLLGTLLMDNQAIEQVNDFLRPEHFLSKLHQEIYQQIEKLIAQGRPADPRTMKDYVDNGKYLLDLASLASTIIDVQEYGKVIYNLAIKRKLIQTGKEIVNEAYAAKEASAESLLEAAEQKLYHLSTINHHGSFKSLHGIIIAIKTEVAENSISTGFQELDEKIEGFKPSDLIILAGRPAMGKTALALNLALHCAKCGTVGMFSLEMSAKQLGRRVLGLIGEEQSLPLFIDDTPALSIASIRTKARRLKRQHDLKILFVDYLQLIKGATKENRVQEISEISSGLKALAKELEITIIALSALSRAVETRESKIPQLSDLRDSGTIEQDADIVAFLYREAYYLEQTTPRSGTAEYCKWQQKMSEVGNSASLIIAKNRNGSIGEVKLHFHPQLTKFTAGN